MELPTTRAEFENLDAPSKRRVKQKLLKLNLHIMCHAVNAEQINQFAPVLHSGDIERLMLSRQRNSSMTVMTDFFMTIQRSLDLNPAWWDILEEILLNTDAYFLMNPWERRRQSDGGAAGGGGGGGGRNHLSGSGATPPGPVAAPGAHPPYPKGTPLAETQGLADCLGDLCTGGHWRDLAEHMGLVHGDHQWVLGQAAQGQGRVPHLLLDRVISLHGDSATVDTLTQALQQLGREGQAVLTRMVDRRLIQWDGAGSGAGGGAEGWSQDAPSYNSNGSPASRGCARNEETTGREGSRFEAQNIPVFHSSHPGVGSSWPAPPDPNLSNSLLPKETPQPILSGIIPPSIPSPPPADPGHLALQRSRSEARERSPDSNLMHRTQSVPVRSQDLSSANQDSGNTGEELRTSTDSLTDNEREFNLAQPLEEEDKILNSQGPDHRGARPKTRRRSMDTGGNGDQDRENLVTDGPSSLDGLSQDAAFGPPVPNRTAQSPETQTPEAGSSTSDRLQEDREAPDAGSSGSQENLDEKRRTVNIINNTFHHNHKTYINIHDPTAVQIGETNKAFCAPAPTQSNENHENENPAEGAGRQEDVVLPTPTAVQDEQPPVLATAPAGVREGFSHARPLGETPPDQTGTEVRHEQSPLLATAPAGVGEGFSPTAGLEIRRLEESLQPSPLDDDAHQTAVKQRQFEEEPEVEAEGEREEEENEIVEGEADAADEEEEEEEEEEEAAPDEREAEEPNGFVDLHLGNRSGPSDDDQSLGTVRSDNSLNVYPRADNSLSLLAQGVPQPTQEEGHSGSQQEEGHSGSQQEQQPQQSTSILSRIFSSVKNAYDSLE